MKVHASLAVLLLGIALAAPAGASDVGYIYGRVEVKGGNTYEGQIRWGTEESFWDDIFNATKVENENLDYVDDEVLDRLHRHHRNAMTYLFGVQEHDFTHIFAARFGDLKRIQVGHGDDVVVTFRDGDQLKLSGGSNDIGAQIKVVDPKRGEHTLDWDRIRSIEFADTPAKLGDKLGEPIYGVVKSGKYEFKGRIQWDNDECLTADKLDGHTDEGKVSIAFGEIESIRKHRDGAMVKLKSGEELFVSGTNDVNDENRGIVVVMAGVGSVKIGWDDFDQVAFERAPNTGRSYADYAKGHDLTGSVTTRSGHYDGRIVFDLDESRDLELLQGTNGDTEYLIPFRDIERITPKGSRRADVVLHNGLTIELEDGQDVSRKNDGLLVFAGSSKPTYVPWADVTEVEFR